MTDAQVVWLREQYRAGRKIKDLAREVGLSDNSTGRAISGKTYAHVPNPVHGRTIVIEYLGQERVCVPCQRTHIVGQTWRLRTRNGKVVPYPYCDECMKEHWRKWNNASRNAEASKVPETTFMQWRGPVTAGLGARL